MSDCHITELPTNSCSHCAGVKKFDGLETPIFEEHDYVKVRAEDDLLDDTRPGGHAFNPTLPQFTDEVDWKDIYGQHKATRLRKVNAYGR